MPYCFIYVFHNLFPYFQKFSKVSPKKICINNSFLFSSRLVGYPKPHNHLPSKNPKKDTTIHTSLFWYRGTRRLWTLDSDSFVRRDWTLNAWWPWKRRLESTKSNNNKCINILLYSFFLVKLSCICSCWVFYRFFLKHSSKYKFTSIWHQLGRSNKQFREKDWNTTSPLIKAIYLPSLKLTVRTPANWWLGFDKFPFGVRPPHRWFHRWFQGG